MEANRIFSGTEVMMDCPQCGRNGFMPGKACGDCGYLAAGTGVPEEPSEDMPLDELNRMLGELGIEPITEVVRRAGPEPVPSAKNIQVEVEDGLTPLESIKVEAVDDLTPLESIIVEAVDDLTPLESIKVEAVDVLTPLENVQVEDAAVFTPIESFQVVDADVFSPVESILVEDVDVLAPLESVRMDEAEVAVRQESALEEKPDLPEQLEDVPMKMSADEIEMSGEDMYRRDVPEDASPEGKSLSAATEGAPVDAVEDLPTAVRQTAPPQKRLKDVRHKAGPVLSAVNFFRALAGWVPGLLAGAVKAVKKKPSAAKTKREAAVAESLPSERDNLSPEAPASAVTQEPEPPLSLPDEGDALLRELLSQGSGGTTPAGNEGEEETGTGTDPSTGALFEEPVISVAGEKAKTGTGREVKPRERKKPEPMSPRVRNLIFWIAVPLAFVVMVVGLLRFILVLRDRSLVAEIPKETEEWHYVPWSPEADIPPTPVTIEAVGDAIIP